MSELLKDHGDQKVIELAADLLLPRSAAVEVKGRKARKPAPNSDKLGAKVLRQDDGKWHVVANGEFDGTVIGTIGDAKVHIRLEDTAHAKIAALVG